MAGTQRPVPVLNPVQLTQHHFNRLRTAPGVLGLTEGAPDTPRRRPSCLSRLSWVRKVASCGSPRRGLWCITFTKLRMSSTDVLD